MMRSLIFAPGAVAVALLAACPVPLTGQASKSLKAPGPKTGSPLATIGSTVITVEEFDAKINQQSPFIRSRYADIEKRREYLDNQIRFELLAQEAESRGIHNDADVRDSLKKIMVQKLTRDEFDNRVKLDDRQSDFEPDAKTPVTADQRGNAGGTFQGLGAVSPPVLEQRCPECGYRPVPFNANACPSCGILWLKARPGRQTDRLPATTAKVRGNLYVCRRSANGSPM